MLSRLLGMLNMEERVEEAVRQRQVRLVQVVLPITAVRVVHQVEELQQVTLQPMEEWEG